MLAPVSPPLIRRSSASERTLWIHLGAVLALSVAWEGLFLHHGISLIDEGWPVYAAQRLHAGGSLYRDVFWVYPPGHLLAAWVGWALDPPGIVVARAIYSAFTVAACLGTYLLGRALLPPRLALAAALVLAVAAPWSHQVHIVFGYLYQVFGLLALVAFGHRLERDDARGMLAAGFLLGVGGAFRLYPTLAAGAAIGLAVITASRSPRRWLEDWALLALGLLCTLGVVALVLGLEVGFAALWRELVARPQHITVLADTPPPALVLSSWGREPLRDAFVALEFRLAWVLYVAYLVTLVAAWIRARLRGEDFRHALLLAVSVYGAVLFTRTVSRSDEAHLDSALPPLCLLSVHAAWLLGRRLLGRARAPAWGERAFVTAWLAAWVLLTGADLWLSEERRGGHPIQATGGSIRVSPASLAEGLDGMITQLRGLPPGVKVLDLTVSPMLYPLSGRMGPGGFDVVLPGIFLDRSEEEGFVERLSREPRLVLLFPREVRWRGPRWTPSSAPLLWEWARAKERESRTAAPP